MEIVIWFNSTEGVYEMGTIRDLQVSQEYYQTVFEILYEFNSYTKYLARKVINSLNEARMEAAAA